MLKALVVGTGRSGTTMLINLLGSHSKISPMYELEYLQILLNWVGEVIDKSKSTWHLCPVQNQSCKYRFEGDKDSGCGKSGILETGEVWKSCPYDESSMRSGNILGLCYEWSRDDNGLPFDDVWDSNYDKSRPKFGSKYVRITKEEFIKIACEFIDDIKTKDAIIAIREYVNKLIGIHCGNDNKEHCIIKTPAFLRLRPLVEALYPEIKWIHIFRDPRDVWASLKGFWWGPKTIKECSNWWGSIHKVLDGTNTINIKYETFVQNGQTKELFEWLGLKDENVGFKPTTRSIGRYKKDLTTEEIDEFNEHLGDLLVQKGYET